VVADTPDNTQSNATLAAITAGGGHVYVGGAPESSSSPSSPYIHAKAIVVDGTTAWVGSENFSDESLSRNRELGVVFSDPEAVQDVLGTIRQDAAHGRTLR
jgi:phosphatidylserine/phosphatidylglycerophosphate/cardiolipin synthase-like enzyme